MRWFAMSAFGGKAAGNWSPCFRLLLTLNGLCHPPQSEALQSDPANACGGQRNRKAGFDSETIVIFNSAGQIEASDFMFV